jgi:hypothetical protein
MEAVSPAIVRCKNCVSAPEKKGLRGGHSPQLSVKDEIQQVVTADLL